MKTGKRKLFAIILTMAMVVTTVEGVSKKDIIGRAATDYGIGNPVVDENGITSWDCIYFGNYWQNDTNGDGTADQKDDKEPIKWRVLSVDGDDAFLMADQILDIKQYSDKDYEDVNKNGKFEEDKDELVTWENSNIRTWLNHEFYETAFSEDERNSIIETSITNEGETDEKETCGLLFPAGKDTVDKIYLASKAEMENSEYGMSADFTGKYKRMTTNTDYARQVNSTVNEYESFGKRWWLRAPRGYAVYDGQVSWAAYIDSYFIPIEDYYGIRPVLHLDLSNDVWEKTDPVSVNGLIETKEYLVENEKVSLFRMSDGDAYIKIGSEEAENICGSNIKEIGLGRDGMLYFLEKDEDGSAVRYAHNWEYDNEKFDALEYLGGLDGSGVCYFLTEDGLDVEYADNVEELVFDNGNYVTGYRTSEGKTISVLSYDEMKRMEQKNKNDIEVLTKIINEQKALGASIEEDIDDSWTYDWNEAGRLYSITWDGDGLKGSLSLEGLEALQRFDCDDNDLTSLDVSKNTKLVSLSCRNNKLTFLDISGNPDMQLYYEGNPTTLMIKRTPGEIGPTAPPTPTPPQKKDTSIQNQQNTEKPSASKADTNTNTKANNKVSLVKKGSYKCLSVGGKVVSKYKLKKGVLTWKGSKKSKKVKPIKRVKQVGFIKKSKNLIYITKKGKAYTISPKGKKKTIVKKGAKKLIFKGKFVTKVKKKSGYTNVVNK